MISSPPATRRPRGQASYVSPVDTAAWTTRGSRDAWLHLSASDALGRPAHLNTDDADVAHLQGCNEVVAWTGELRYCACCVTYELC